MVEINGLQVAGFSEISGLDAEIETEQIYEGGLNNFVYNLPKKVKYGRLSLKKGISLSSELIDWFEECKNGLISKKDITIFLCSSLNKNVFQWNVIGAFPVKFSGPRLIAQNSNEIAIETIEMIFQELNSKSLRKND